jgi:hypothetical protein
MKAVILRKDAIRLGLKRYFTGKPCCNGHIAERQTSNRGCVVCIPMRDAPYRKAHPEMCAAATARWRKANHEKYSAYMTAKATAWGKANPEKFKANMAAYQKAHLAECAARWAKRHAAKLRACPPWADIERIKMIYRTAAVIRVYFPCHVDHIVPLQNSQVSGLHVHQNLQIISVSANCSKANNFQGIK